jgi:carbon-monoxide dehydrogenase large subunit
MHILADLGAYPIAPVIPELTGQMAVGVYRIPAVDIDIQCVYTHVKCSGSFASCILSTI